MRQMDIKHVAIIGLGVLALAGCGAAPRTAVPAVAQVAVSDTPPSSAAAAESALSSVGPEVAQPVAPSPAPVESQAAVPAANPVSTVPVAATPSGINAIRK